MQPYYYGLWLLALSVVLINSRFVFRSIDNGRLDDVYHPNSYYSNRVNQPNDVNKLLNYLVALDSYGGDYNNEAMSFERRRKSIGKGDPREFMG